MARHLAQRARKGIDVRVIYDGVGSFHSDHKMFEMDARTPGSKCAENARSHKLNRRWHQKHFIVDGKIAITGGMNIGDLYANGGQTVFYDHKLQLGWRDMDMRIEGPAVRDYQFSFLRNWAQLGPDVTGEASKSASYMRAPQANAHGVDIALAQSDPRRGVLTTTSERCSTTPSARRSTPSPSRHRI